MSIEVDELSSILHDYCRSKSPGHAIMVNGPWGVGKTRLIRDCITKLGKNNCHKVLHISLFGVEKTAQIQDLLVTKITSLDGVSEKDIKASGNIFSGVLKTLTDVESPTAFGAIFSSIGSSVKDRIISVLKPGCTIVFDDLERCLLDPVASLSVINQFVEHHQLNAIIVCDESKINATRKKEYFAYKEKVVLYTYHIERTSAQVTDIAMSVLPDMDKKLFESVKREMFRLFELIPCQNLRTINFAMTCFGRLLSKLDEQQHAHRSDPRLSELVFACLVFSIGYREEKLSTQLLKKFSNDLLALEFTLRNIEENEGENCEWKSFYETVVKVGHRPIKYSSIFNLVCFGYIDNKLLHDDVAALFQDLNDFIYCLEHREFNFSDQLFSTNMDRVIGQISSKSLTVSSPVELYALCYNLHDLVKRGAYDYDLHELEHLIECFVIKKTSEFGDEYEGVRSLGVPETEFGQNLKDLISGNFEKHQQEGHIKKLRESALSVLSSRSREMANQQANYLYQQSQSVWLEKDFVDDLVAKIKVAEPERIELFRLTLRDRYKSASLENVLSDEQIALERLKNELEAYEKTLEKSLTKYRLADLVHLLTSLLENCQAD